MRRLEENCNICGKAVARFHAFKLLCHHCGEVVCRHCLAHVPGVKPRWNICRKCEGAYS
tara:strand:- start:104 stop:280 length:177 start_codon:yes stop_codon:yes gene_type:complete